MGNSLFIVIEGPDEHSTATQLNLLKERLGAVGYEVVLFQFPRLKQPSGYFAKKYISGEYGPVAKISPYTASLFYSLDRYEAAKDIKTALDEGKIVLASNYAGANMAIQGAKFIDDVEKRSFFVWADNLEFQLLDIPRPNFNFYLRMPAGTILANNARKDGVHIKPRQLTMTYDLLCQLFPKDFKAIECTKKDKLLSVPEINNLIWEQLKSLLPAKKSHSSRSVVVTLGLNNDTDHQQADSSENVLEHQFKDGSLVLRLYLQRLVPDGISHGFEGWHEGVYEFYSPSRLPKDTLEKYRQGFEQLSVFHQQIGQKMTKFIDRSGQKPKYSLAQILQPIIPLGAISSFKLSLKKEDVYRVAENLLANDSEELQWAAKQLYLTARQKWPKDFERPLETADGPIALNNIIAKMAGQRLPQVYSLDESIKLLEARPRLEFDLLAETVYPYSSLSLEEISEEVSDWPYSQKYQSLKEAASQTEVLRKIVYKLDILSDHLTLDKIAQTARPRNLQVQSSTPRYGYDMPLAVDQAAADDLFDSAFDESLKLYSLLQSADREDLTPYVTLLGHKVRWQMSVTAAELKPVFLDLSLLNSPVINVISEKLAEVHPLLWDVITDGHASSPAPEPKGKARVKPANRPHTKRKRR